jgi:hypothetical protein
MTKKEINIAVAECCGWHAENSGNKYSDLIFNPRGNSAKRWVERTFGRWVDTWASGVHVPDYCADLNAMHEAEKLLLPDHYGMFVWWLMEMSPKADFVTHATARQRAEAFLRTLGKWRETTTPATPAPAPALTVGELVEGARTATE